MKKLIGIGLSAIAMALVVTSTVGAAGISGVNDSSSATITSVKKIINKLSNGNGVGLLNLVVSSGNSGGNTVTSADDQTKTTVASGDASSASLVDSTANTNSVAEDYESASAADSVATIDDSSSATIDNEDELKNEVENENGVEVFSDVIGSSDSGTNTVASGDSLSETMVTTGGSGAAAGLLQVFNTNIKDIVHRVKFPPMP